jgi:hypothetical protein
MAKRFNDVGIKSLAIWSDTPTEERKSALQKLANKEVNVIFSVDLFNEGVDVPSVDTLFMLRPTESPTLFLQQLGRGLRKHDTKSVCTVLDFVGRQHQDFRFDVKLRALLGGTRKQLEQQVKDNFPYLPAGCHMELDRVASEIVLQSIKQSVPNRWLAKVQELQLLAVNNNDVAIATYLNETGLDLEDIYTSSKSWTELQRDAGISTLEPGPNEEPLLRAVGRLLHADDPDRLATYKLLADSETAPDLANMPIKDKRYFRMLIASLVDQVVGRDASLEECIELLWQNPQVLKELSALFEYLTTRVSHLAKTVDQLSDVPLSIHARYTRIEILAAFGVGNNARTPTWREGVLWANEAKADLIVFTLDKTSGHFSPTTRYRDYAISRDLIHWESQAGTRTESNTGKRYQNHAKHGSKIMLFSRINSDERSFYFLGAANYVRHESEMPMSITWKLDSALPGDLFTSFVAAVA